MALDEFDGGESPAQRPRKLYKYRSLAASGAEYAKATLLRGEVFFDNPANFNDPFECLPAFEFSATETELITYYTGIVRRKFPRISEREVTLRALQHRMQADRQPGDPEFAIQHLALYREQVLPKLPMLCLSATAQNVLMWSHYAANHAGICLEFDGHSPVFDRLKRIDYQKSGPLSISSPAFAPRREWNVPCSSKAKTGPMRRSGG